MYSVCTQCVFERTVAALLIVALRHHVAMLRLTQFVVCTRRGRITFGLHNTGETVATACHWLPLRPTANWLARTRRVIVVALANGLLAAMSWNFACPSQSLVVLTTSPRSCCDLRYDLFWPGQQKTIRASCHGELADVDPSPTSPFSCLPSSCFWIITRPMDLIKIMARMPTIDLIMMGTQSKWVVRERRRERERARTHIDLIRVRPSVGSLGLCKLIFSSSAACVERLVCVERPVNRANCINYNR